MKNQKSSKQYVIEIGGTQHIVVPGDVISINRIPGKKGDKIAIEKVLLMSDSGEVKIGTPEVGLTISAEIIEHLKGPKIDVSKYKAKSRYRKAFGHRQDLTKLKIIEAKASSASTSAKKSASPVRKPKIAKTKAKAKTK